MSTTGYARRKGNLTARRRLAAVAVGVGVAAAGGHGVAWADTAHHDSGNTHSAGPSHSSAPSKKVSSAAPQKHSHHRNTDSTAPRAAVKPHRTTPKKAATASAHDAPPANAPRRDKRHIAPVLTPAATALKSAAVSDISPIQPSTATTAPTVKPLSPIAKLIALPGRIINTVLQIFDVTVAKSGPKSPFNWAPIDEALFAAFRGLENMLGFNTTPAKQQTPPTLTYDGPVDDKTPTVAQFLNASADAYTLGGQPGDLKPFTVNGFQMRMFNPFSGAVGKAWVTPQGQIIIAYQGTTGGTNLLFHPLIAITQLFADLQVMFTNTTPWAFYDSLAFQKKVTAAAVKQGYSADDIFLTGHSLGGWEAQYVAQKSGLGGIGFEGPGLNTKLPGNGAGSGFVNVETYGDSAAYFSTDLPGLAPFMPPYVPGGGSKPHYGSIVMIGDPDAVNPLQNVSKLWGWNPIGDLIFAIDMLGNFFEHHLPGMQAYNLGVAPDPGVVPWLGATMGPVRDWGDLTIGQLQQAASDAGVLFAP